MGIVGPLFIFGSVYRSSIGNGLVKKEPGLGSNYIDIHRDEVDVDLTRREKCVVGG